nr:DUF1700 domain-containing protein [Bacillus pakistanensis]
MPHEDREALLYDYKEYFEAASAEGKTDAEVIEELGSPKVIARELLANYNISIAEKNCSIKNIMNAIIASLSLGFFNAVLIVGPAIGILGVFLGCCVLAIALSLSPLILFSGLFFDGTMNIWLTLFSSFILCGFGVMFCIGLMNIGRFLYNILIRYIKLNANIVKGANHS